VTTGHPDSISASTSGGSIRGLRTAKVRPRPGHRPELARGGEDGVFSQIRTSTMIAIESSARYEIETWKSFIGL
jgi:hypothetical protein